MSQGKRAVLESSKPISPSNETKMLASYHAVRTLCVCQVERSKKLKQSNRSGHLQIKAQIRHAANNIEEKVQENGHDGARKYKQKHHK